jgi:pimeloyl-ACP methyl ester carboxylesterase
MSSEYRILALDLLGHGDSDKPKIKVPIEKQVDLIHEVVVSRDLHNFFLIGHSVGGYLSMIYAAKYPDEISGVIFVDIAPREMGAKRPSRAVPEVFFSENEAWSYFKETYPNFSDEAIENRLKYGFIISSNGRFQWKANFESLDMVRESFVNYDFWPHLQRIEAPILLIKGGESITVSTKALERMKNVLKDFTVVEFEGVGHQIPLESPKNFQKEVKKFILEKSEG